MPPPLLPAPVWLNREPLHKQLKAELMRHVAQGLWMRGDTLPTESELSAHYRVSISTVRAAIGSLVEAGLLVRRAGRGTHVAARGGKDSVYRFFHLVSDQQITGLPVSEVLDFTKDKATSAEISAFGLPTGKTQVLRLRNVLRLQGQAVQTAQVTLPAHLFLGMSAGKLNAANDTLYGAYQKLFGITVLRTEDRIRAAIASPSTCRQLDLPTGSPVLQMQRISYTFDDIVIELRTMDISTQAHHFFLEQGGA
jgi:GntR family transcriptional regulator